MLPRLAHGTGGRPGARGWIVNLGTGKDRVKRNGDCLRPRSDLLPPATSTLPFGNNVAVCEPRGVWSEPVGVQMPLAGS